MGLKPLSSPECPSAREGGPVAPLKGSIAHAPAPLAGGGMAGIKGAEQCSWDPTAFRHPDTKPVSCYSRQIFSGGALPSAKPGSGFKKPDCGKWVRKLRSGNEVRDIYHNCGNLMCPACMSGTLTDRAHDVEERFRLYDQAKSAENAVLVPGEKRGIYARHFVFTMSPAHQADLVQKVVRSCDGWDEKAFLDLAREELTSGIKQSGLIGGFSVYHDARVRHPDTGATGSRAKHLILMEAKCQGNFKDGDPSWVLYDHIRKQKNHADYFYFAPHFHIQAFGRIIEAQEFEKLCLGWTYHNKGPVKGVGGLSRYLLSHMAMIEDRKSCTWWGRLSSKCLGKRELRTYDRKEVHPETGLPWIIVDSVISDEIGAQYTVSVTEYEGFFRGKTKKKPPDPDKITFPKIPSRKRASPPGVYAKGILAMAKYCDENGHL